MADSPKESPAQEKARLRRERRAAKIQEGGASRLQAITSLQGGTHRDVSQDVPSRPTPTASPGPQVPSRTDTPDPDEVDISNHYYQPATQPRLPPSQPFNNTSMPPFPDGGFGQGSDPSQDPMMLLQQMLGGGAPGGTPGQPGQPGLPPHLANIMSAMQGGGAAAEPSPDQSSAWIWRLVHAIFSLVLAVYIVLQTPFTGSKLARTSPGAAEDDWTLDTPPAEAMKHFFYMFATFEVVMQSSRYFIEKGQLQGSGILSTVANFLPEPYGGYVRMIGRYSVIYSTVVSDAMVVVFVLGAASWWNGAVAA